jgi:hypothetical protein
VKLAFAALAILWAAAACGSVSTPGSGGSVDISNVRRSGTPPAYWLGERFAGLPLTANAGSATRPSFIYGTCDPSPHGGCAPPLELQHWPLSERGPGVFQIAPGRRTNCRLPSVSRVTAAIFATTGGVEVYLGDRVVVLFGKSGLVRKAMLELRPVKPQQPALPRPPAWVFEQLRRCAPPAPELKLNEWRTAGRPTVYWVGSSFGGHPLATAEGDEEEVRLVYGECARDELAFERACWPPLEILVGPLQSPSYAPGIECRTGSAQGARTALLPSAHTLDVFAGDRRIRLIGRDLGLLRAAADALRLLGASERDGPLPPTPPSVARSLEDHCAQAAP